MTGPDLKRIRDGLSLGVVAFGRKLGYRGNDNTVSVQIREMERGKKPVPPDVSQRASKMVLDHMNGGGGEP